MKKLTLAISSVLLAASTYDVQATNGYFAHGYSSSEKGTAGAGVAWGRDSLAIATNPANLMHLEERTDLGFSIFNPNRSYTITGNPSLPAGFTPVIGGFPGCANPGVEPCQVPFSQTPGKVDSSRNYFVIPSFGMTFDIDDSSKWGIAIYGNGGMNTQYESGSAVVLDPMTNTMVELPGTFGAGDAGVDAAGVERGLAVDEVGEVPRSVGRAR